MSTTKDESCVSFKQIELLEVFASAGESLTLDDLRGRGMKNAPGSVLALTNRYKMLAKNGAGEFSLTTKGRKFLERVRATVGAPSEDTAARLDRLIRGLQAACNA